MVLKGSSNSRVDDIGDAGLGDSVVAHVLIRMGTEVPSELN